MKQPRHVFVRWRDITGHQGWVSRGEARRRGKTTGVWSTGFVVEDSKKQMILVQDSADDGDVNGRETIPRGCIQKVIETKLPFKVEKEEEA